MKFRYFSQFRTLCFIIISGLILYYAGNDEEYKVTCLKNFEGKIKSHSTYGGVIGVKISNNEKLLFSLLNNETDSFYKYIHRGMYLKKEKNSNVLLISEDSLFRFNNKSWLIMCHGFRQNILETWNTN